MSNVECGKFNVMFEAQDGDGFRRWSAPITPVPDGVGERRWPKKWR